MTSPRGPAGWLPAWARPGGGRSPDAGDKPPGGGRLPGWLHWVRTGVVIALLVVLYFLVPTDTHPQRGDVARIVICLLLVGVLTVGIAWQVRVQVLEPERHVDGLLIALVVAVLAFATAFYALAHVNPQQIHGLHTRLDALYFTVTTLMTVGFGDIYAAGQLARAIVLVQMVFNVAVLATAATALGRKVRDRALERAQERAQQRAERAEQRAEQGGQSRRTHRNPT